MELTATNILALALEWKAIIQEKKANLPTEHEAWFFDLPCTNLTQAYQMLARISRISKWMNDRDAGNFQRFLLQLHLEVFQSTVDVDARQIQYDAFGQYRAELENLPNDEVLFKRALRDDMLLNGHGSDAKYVGYDEVPLFSKVHPIDKQFVAAGKQVNYYTSTDLTIANVKTMRAAMKALKAPSGEPMGINPNILWYTGDLEAKKEVVLDQDRLDPDYKAKNTLYEAFTPLELTTGEGAWGLADLRDPGMLPIIFGHGIHTDPRWLVEPGDEKRFGKYGYDFDWGTKAFWWQKVARADV